MPRVNHIKSARPSKRRRSCFRCGHEIQVGEAYKKWSFRMRPRGSRTVYACKDHSPRASDLTQSPHLAGFYSAQESATDALNDWRPEAPPVGEEPDAAEVDSILESCAEEFRAVAEGLRESAEAITDGFGHETYQSEELEERAQTAEDAADQLEADFDVPFFETPEDAHDDGASEEQREAAWQQAFDAWVEETRDAAQSAVDEAEAP